MLVLQHMRCDRKRRGVINSWVGQTVAEGALQVLPKEVRRETRASVLVRAYSDGGRSFSFFLFYFVRRGETEIA